MELFRVHAYTVSPQRTTAATDEPDGGAVTINADLRRAIEENVQSARFDKRTIVDFHVDPSTRTNSIRDAILDYAFGEPAKAKSAALALARQLSKAMDLRSSPCLLIPAAFRNETSRAVAVWTFPRDDAFRLRRGNAGPSIEILTDVFSQTSHLRKAAYFRGRDARTEFLSGRVLDYQANHASRDVADFWIARFLECRFGIGGDAGTRLLARTVRRTYEECKEPDDREMLYAAVMSMRRSPHKRLSLHDFADRYLEGPVKDVFVASAPNADSIASTFQFDTAVFDGALNFRVFHLATGVFVSSPLTEIGQSVQVSQGDRRQLTCRGEVLNERLRSRHA